MQCRVFIHSKAKIFYVFRYLLTYLDSKMEKSAEQAEDPCTPEVPHVFTRETFVRFAMGGIFYTTVDAEHLMSPNI